MVQELRRRVQAFRIESNCRCGTVECFQSRLQVEIPGSELVTFGSAATGFVHLSAILMSVMLTAVQQQVFGCLVGMSTSA